MTAGGDRCSSQLGRGRRPPWLDGAPAAIDARLCNDDDQPPGIDPEPVGGG